MKPKIKIHEPERLSTFLRKKRDKSEDLKALILKIVDKIGDVKEVSTITEIPESTIYEWIREWSDKKEASMENHRGRRRQKTETYSGTRGEAKGRGKEQRVLDYKRSKDFDKRKVWSRVLPGSNSEDTKREDENEVLKAISNRL